MAALMQTHGVGLRKVEFAKLDYKGTANLSR